MKHLVTLLSVLALWSFAQSAIAQVGTVDLDFNGTGYFSKDYGPVDVFQDVITQEDGKIICTGVYLTPNFTGVLTVIRLNSDGTPDDTFAEDGVFTFLIGQETYGVESAVTTDGKIIVAGINYIEDYTSDFMVLRLNADGTLDSSFGTDGYTLVDFDDVDQLTQAMALQSDGKILISGTSIDTTTYDYHNAPTIIRLSADGVHDMAFGTDGMVQIPTAFIDNELTTIKVQPDGKIVAAGHFEQAFDGSSDFDILLIRTDENGVLDPGFGENGVSITAVDAGVDDSFGMDFDSEGNIYSAGFTTVAFTAAFNMVLLKFHPDGSLDTTFGTNGMVQDSSDPINYANDLLIQADQKILVAGGIGSNFEGAQKYALWRFLPDGQADPVFGTNGLITTDVTGSSQECNSLALQADGKILAAGKGDFTNGRDMLVVRFLNDVNVGLEDIISTSDPSFYPNPLSAGSMLYVRINGSSTPLSQIRLLDLSGRSIHVMDTHFVEELASGEYRFRIPTDLRTGSYLLELSDTHIRTSKLIHID